MSDNENECKDCGDYNYLESNNSCLDHKHKNIDEKTNHILQELNEIKEIMDENVQSIQVQVVNLDDLNEKSDQMKIHSEEFKKKTTFINNKEWWKNKKLYVEIGCVLFAILIVLGIAISVSIQK
jgi:hypothetical protein